MQLKLWTPRRKGFSVVWRRLSLRVFVGSISHRVFIKRLLFSWEMLGSFVVHRVGVRGSSLLVFHRKMRGGQAV